MNIEYTIYRVADRNVTLEAIADGHLNYIDDDYLISIIVCNMVKAHIDFYKTIHKLQYGFIVGVRKSCYEKPTDYMVFNSEGTRVSHLMIE